MGSRFFYRSFRWKCRAPFWISGWVWISSRALIITRQTVSSGVLAFAMGTGLATLEKTPTACGNRRREEQDDAA